MKAAHRDLNLLPFQTKWVGFGLLLISVIAIIITKATHLQPGAFAEELLKSLPILALLLVALSKNRTEDELTLRIRVRAMAGAFVFVCVYVLVMPFIDLISESDVQLVSGRQVLLSSLVMYFVLFYIQKRGR